LPHHQALELISLLRNGEMREKDEKRGSGRRPEEKKNEKKKKNGEKKN
jgi:hypothetical protein